MKENRRGLPKRRNKGILLRIKKIEKEFQSTIFIQNKEGILLEEAD